MSGKGTIDRKTEKEMRKVFGRRFRERGGVPEGPGLEGGRMSDPDTGTRRGSRKRSGWKAVAMDLLFIALVIGAVFLYESDPVWRYAIAVTTILFYVRMSERMRLRRFGRSVEKTLNLLLLLLILFAVVAVIVYL